MKKIIIFLIVLFIFLHTTNFSYAREVPFNQEDRDRLIKLEAKVDEGFKAVNQRIEDTKFSLQKQIDDLKTFILWGFGILFGGMGILMGFVIWDRRTALAPAIKKNKELENKQEKIEQALKELATKDPKMAKVLKNVGLL